MVIDPAYATRTGHNYSVNSLLVEQGQLQGLQVVVFANAALSPEPNTSSVFHASTYAYLPKNDIDALRLSYLLAETFSNDLRQFVQPALRQGDAILLHTINNAMLHGFGNWLRSLGEAALGGISIAFNLPPNMRIYDDDIVRFNHRHYAFAFDLLRETEHQIRYFCDTKAGSRLYSVLGAERVARRGLPTASGDEHQPTSAARPRGPITFFAPGEVRDEKGHLFLINGLVAISQQKLPWLADMRLRFASPAIPDHIRQFLASRPDLFEVIVEPHISNQRYWALLRDADIVVCAYDPKEYSCKSSSILWEALSLGKPVLVSAQSALAEELEEVGVTAGATVRYGDVASLEQALHSTIEAHPRLVEAAASTAEWYRKWVSAKEFLRWIMARSASSA